ncbi:L-rhamnose-H+ transport protein [Chryseolinea serpens]|uniref:L-rhamnose-H+ transport protein n=1 Tax=Chryseolinea serpens TaxID=947013 RepID=A0A1M5TC32_9BACT|nr:L-rhamnose/proton symporter RhaT [Chryseolinea serpens]SHH48337.1 L-rhamnose-H+ transport protein [Chryseolinea serpens]
MTAVLGIVFHFIGGFASGSFYLPFKKIKDWSWESYWLVGGLFSWLVVPPLAAALTIPAFASVISFTPIHVIALTYLMGTLWGIGGLTYGLGIRYLGMSLGNSVTLGYCAAFGALIPSIYYAINHVDGKVSFHDLLASNGGRLVLLGVLVCLAGIALCGYAGMIKEKTSESGGQNNSIVEFNLFKGLGVATISGILSACFNFGIEAGKPMAEMAVQAGYNPLFQNNVTYVVLLWGGLTTNLVWCIFLNFKNGSFKNYTDSKTRLSSNYLFAALAGTTWFLQFFFYGMGESKLGNGASSWILHMAFIILISNIWGILLKEWSGVNQKTKLAITAGILTIVLSVVLVGYGNSIS